MSMSTFTAFVCAQYSERSWVSQNSPISGMEFFLEIEDLPFLISSPFGSTHSAPRDDERFSSTLSDEEDDQVPSCICPAKRRINIFSSPCNPFQRIGSAANSRRLP